MRIKDEVYLSKQDRQHISQYCVQVYEKFIHDNSPFIGYEQCGLSVWHGTYSSDHGLPLNDDLNILIK